jgi:hypothetical protein
MKDESAVRNFVAAVMTKENESAMVRLMNLSPAVYRRCMDDMIDGVVGLPDVSGTPATDVAITQLLDAKENEMTFSFNDGADAGSSYAASNYCRNVLSLDTLLSASNQSATRFSRTDWTRLCSRATLSSAKRVPFYGSEEEIAENYTSGVEVLLPDVTGTFPLDPATLTPPGMTDPDAIALARAVYGYVLIGRGVVEAIHAGEPWKVVVSVDREPAVLLKDHSFSEELFNGFYPYRNVSGIVKSVRADTAAVGEAFPVASVEAMVATALGTDYSKFFRNKITYAIAAQWIAGMHIAAYDAAAQLLSDWEDAMALFELGQGPDPGTRPPTPVPHSIPVATVGQMWQGLSVVIDLMDYMKEYLTGLSGACRRYMKVV